jgi:methyl-accepting chemotaxis protein
MSRFNDLKIGTRLALLTFIFLIGIGGFGLFANANLNQVKINGALYQKIVQGKDLVADILPPPEYIIEAYLNVHQMMDAVNNGAGTDTINPLIEKAKQLRTDFVTRHQVWMDSLPEGDLKNEMVKTAYDPAIAFFDARDRDFIPAIQAGDKVKAQQILHNVLAPAYEEHRKAIDVVVVDANILNQDLEAQAKTQVTSAGIWMFIMGLGIAGLCALLSIFIVASITKPIAALRSVANEVAVGNVDQQISIYSRDEIGDLAEAFRKTITYLQDIASVTRAVSEGDLTVEAAPKSEQDMLGLATVQMLSHLRSLVGMVANNSEGLKSASMQLANNAGMAQQATSQIANTIQQVVVGISHQTVSVTQTASSVGQMDRSIQDVTKGAHNQDIAVAETLEVTDQISAAIHRVSENAEAGERGTQKASEVARRGAHIVSVTIDGMNTIESKVNLSAKKVQEMGERSQQVEVILETIEDIASQTNLLALNAAIEAARAGEHGKSFAVVADEVRKLAERASLATKEIGELIKGILSTVDDAVKSMNGVLTEVQNGVGQAKVAGEALSEILDSANEVNRQVDEIAGAAKEMDGLSKKLIDSTGAVGMVVKGTSTAVQEMSTASVEVTDAIEAIASVSEENSAAAEEVAAGAEEMSAQVQEVSSAAQSLAQMAETLQEAIAQFKLESDRKYRRSDGEGNRAASRQMVPQR